MLLTEVINETDKIFTPEVKNPEPSLDWQRKIVALKEANLPNHSSAAIFDMRCEQAAKIGFKQITVADMVEMLMGEKHTDQKDAKVRQRYEWIYDHHTNKHSDNKTESWGGKPTIFIRKKRRVLFPLLKKEIWRCQFGKMDYLKRQIPYGVILRMQEVKKIGLFNCFNVLAPMEAWERATEIDPIVAATIWELPPPDDEGKERAGQVAHFFLAQWK